MEYVDYYKVLDVERDVSAADLKKKYRQLARKYHPDVSDASDAEERFKQINEAYDVLKDPDKRAAYDQLGANWKQGQEFRPPPGFEYGDAGSFGDIFEHLFSQGGFGGGGFEGFGGFGQASGGQRGFRQRGADLQTSLTIDLEDAIVGREIGVNVNGRQLNVRVPKGIEPGKKIRLAGQGQAGAGGGPAGDLLVEINYRPHTLYRLDGRNILVDLPIAPWEAALGAKIAVPLPGGKKIQLSVPAGSGSGKKLRVSGKGLPGKTPGDFYVVLSVQTPPANSEEDKNFYAEMRQRFEFDPREGLI